MVFVQARPEPPGSTETEVFEKANAAIFSLAEVGPEGAAIVFEVTRKDNKSELRSTHVAWVPAFDCSRCCSWTTSLYIYENLRRLITAGKGPLTGKYKEWQKRRLYDEELELK